MARRSLLMASMNEQIEIVTATPGAHVIRTGAWQVAVGFPEEVVKAWLKVNAQVNAWLVPDVRTAHGIVQWAFEFPLYHALFVRGTFARGEKIPVVVRREVWSDLIDTWIAYKRLHEVDEIRLRPHPWEFMLYYDI